MSDPTQPRWVGLIPVSHEYGRSRRLLVDGQRLLVADRRSGFRVLDASDPANLRELGASYAPGDGYEAALFGRYAVVADRDYAPGDAEAGRLMLFDLSALPTPGGAVSAMPLLTSGARSAGAIKRPR